MNGESDEIKGSGDEVFDEDDEKSDCCQVNGNVVEVRLR